MNKRIAVCLFAYCAMIATFIGADIYNMHRRSKMIDDKVEEINNIIDRINSNIDRSNERTKN